MRVIFIILFLVASLFGQRDSTLSLRCPGVSPNPARAEIKILSGDNILSPCVNRSNIFYSPIVGRINFADSHVYAKGLDLQGVYAGSGETPFVYFDYAFEAAYPSSVVYQGFYNQVKFNAAAVSASSSFIGFQNTAWQTGNSNMHDIQGLTSQALITNGRAGSNINGAAFSVGVFSPATAQDVSAIVLTSQLNNTTVRSFQSIWIQEPTTIDSTVLDGEINALRVGSITNKLFAIAANGQSIQMTFSTPASSTATCRTGTIKVDANNLYVCTSTDTWKLAPLQAF